MPGQKLWAYNEAGALPSSSPYTYTTANAANFDGDLGVVYAASGLALIKVASAPAVGQYSVSAGVYTFSSGDAGKALLVSYSYTQTSGGSRALDRQQGDGDGADFPDRLLPDQSEYRRRAMVAASLQLRFDQAEHRLEDAGFRRSRTRFRSLRQCGQFDRRNQHGGLTCIRIRKSIARARLSSLSAGRNFSFRRSPCGKRGSSCPAC